MQPNFYILYIGLKLHGMNPCLGGTNGGIAKFKYRDCVPMVVQYTKW